MAERMWNEKREQEIRALQDDPPSPLVAELIEDLDVAHAAIEGLCYMIIQDSELIDQMAYSDPRVPASAVFREYLKWRNVVPDPGVEALLKFVEPTFAPGVPHE